ncbi:hypothetical protein, partial [Enterobacter hormaechei]
IAIAALGAVTLGLLVGLSLQGLHVQDTAPVAEVADTPAPVAPAVEAAPEPAPAPATTPPAAAPAPAAPSADARSNPNPDA